MAQQTDAPAGLIPETGVAIGTAEYQSVFIIGIPSPGGLTPLDEPVDLSSSESAVYERPAEGIIVTTEQRWTHNRVGLGRLIHSLSLAPGESTRLAVVDWSRGVSGAAVETTAQTEAVTEGSARSRGVSEITDALAAEEQTGSSVMGSRSQSTSGGGSIGALGWGASFSGSSNKSLATSVSVSSGKKRLSAASTQKISERTVQLATAARDRRASVVKEIHEAERSEAGTRVVTNYNHMHTLNIQYWEMVQEYRVMTRRKRLERALFIPLKTMRFSAALLQRYAPVLASVAPPEWRDRIALVNTFDPGVYLTRSIGNPGDMVGVAPMGTSPPRLAHFAYAPNSRYCDPGKVGDKEWNEIKGSTSLPTDFWGVTHEKQLVAWNTKDWVPCGWVRCDYAKVDEKTWQDEVGEGRSSWADMYGVTDDKSAVRHGTRPPLHWHEERFGGLGKQYPLPDGVTYGCTDDGTPTRSIRLRRRDASARPPHAQAAKLAVWWKEGDLGGICGVKIEMGGASEDSPLIGVSEGTTRELEFLEGQVIKEITLARSLPLNNVVRISVITETADGREESHDFGRDATSKDDETCLDIGGGRLCGLFGTFGEGRIFSLGFQVRGADQGLVQHLNDNALTYSQAIWASADGATLGPVLARYTYHDTPLGPRLDPTPIAMTGNYLGFRWSFEDENAEDAWREAQGWSVEQEAAEEQWWLKAQTEIEPGSETPEAIKVEKVAIPTDGVFAEAVLGRSIAAEKLDITRFWDWKNNPIPILPPDIAPVDTGSRARDLDLDSRALEPTAAAIHGLAGLPALTGLAAGLQAMAAASMFRDMSGRDALSEVMQTGIKEAVKGDEAAAKRANEAMEIAGKNITEAMKAAADLAPMLLGPAGAAGGVLEKMGPLTLGSLINLGSQDGKGGTTK